MKKLKISRLLAMADTYQKLAQQLDPKEQRNQMFQQQRERVDKFARAFIGKCRAILHEMDGDIFTLIHRKFDPQMLDMMKDLKSNIEYIYKKIDLKNPYVRAYELVDYILDKPTMMVIDNLEFLVQHHLKSTAPKGNLPPFALSAEINSLQKLQDFAYSMKVYMDRNPMIHIPEMTAVPPQPNPAVDPGFLASPDEDTHAPGTQVSSEELAV